MNDRITERIIAAAIEVHRHPGPGLLESVYEECLCHELDLMGIQFERQVHVPVAYKGLKPESAYRADLAVGNSVVEEVKAIEGNAPVHQRPGISASIAEALIFERSL